FDRPEESILRLLEDEDAAPRAGGARVDGARAPLNLMLDFERLSCDRPRIEGACRPVQGPQGGDADRGRRAQSSPARDPRPDFDPERPFDFRLPHARFDVAIPRLIERRSVREPLLVRPGIP